MNVYFVNHSRSSVVHLKKDVYLQNIALIYSETMLDS